MKRTNTNPASGDLTAFYSLRSSLPSTVSNEDLKKVGNVAERNKRNLSLKTADEVLNINPNESKLLKETNKNEFFNSSKTGIWILDLDPNKTKTLKVIHFNDNKLEAIPKKLSQFENLQELNLSNNKLKKLDKCLTSLKKLKLLNLNNNKLAEWPDWLCSDMTQLTSLFLSGNPLIPSIPLTFVCMRYLNRLSFDWFAYGLKDGNCNLEEEDARKYISLTKFMCTEEKKKENTSLSSFAFFQYLVEYNKAFAHYPIHISCVLGHLSITKYLLHNNHNPNVLDNKGNSALYLAISNDNIKSAEILLASPLIDVNGCSNRKELPIFSAIVKKEFALVSRIISHPTCNVNVCDSNRNTILHYLFARFDTNPLIISRLSEKLIKLPGYNVNKRNLAGQAASHYAAGKNQISAITFILNWNKNLEEKKFDLDLGDNNGVRLLHYVAVNMSPEIIIELIKAKVDVLAKDLKNRKASDFVKNSIAGKILLQAEQRAIRRQVEYRPECVIEQNTKRVKCGTAVKVIAINADDEEDATVNRVPLDRIIDHSVPFSCRNVVQNLKNNKTTSAGDVVHKYYKTLRKSLLPQNTQCNDKKNLTAPGTIQYRFLGSLFYNLQERKIPQLLSKAGESNALKRHIMNCLGYFKNPKLLQRLYESEENKVIKNEIANSLTAFKS